MTQLDYTAHSLNCYAPYIGADGEVKKNRSSAREILVYKDLKPSLLTARIKNPAIVGCFLLTGLGFRLEWDNKRKTYSLFTSADMTGLGDWDLTPKDQLLHLDNIKY